MVGRWSSRHSWQNRVAAWDREQDRRRRAARQEESDGMVRRQALQATALQTALMAPARKFLERIQDAADSNEDPFEDYDIRELQRAAETASRVWVGVATFERLARGLSTQNVDLDETAANDMAGRSRQELKNYLLGFDDSTERSDITAEALDEIGETA